MSNQQFITFSARRTGLDKLDEYWQSCDFDTIRASVARDIVKARGYEPNSNNRLFREGAFLIKGSTMIEDIVALVGPIKERFGIECFQIAIDRTNNEAHMLFCCLDKKHRNGHSVAMNNTDHTKLSVYLLRKLHLPRPSCADYWQRYFLLDAYTEDKNVFAREVDRIMHDDNIPARSFDVIQDALNYAENVCKGLVK